MFKHFPFIHNHGDFVHLDALRDWLRGVVSLESFLKSKNDKAIIKDMHFTDETTSVDYIDTKNDVEKTETLCEYLTSDVFDETNSTQFNKVDKITVRKDNHSENWLDMREKATQIQRLGVIRSNVPIAYDATDNYATSQKVAHIGITENGVNIYDDDTLELIKKYDFMSGGSELLVHEQDLPTVDPFISVQDKTGNTSLQLHKRGDFHATIIHDTVISGQVDYALSGDLHIEAGKYVVLQLNTGSTGDTGLIFSNVYPKYAQVEQNTKGLITQITSVGERPTIGEGSPTFLTIYNQTEDTVSVENLHFTF